jgi:hypothetical protein
MTTQRSTRRGRMTNRSVWTVATTAMFVAAMATSGASQWLGHPQPGVPIGADGKPRLDAPTPKTADGRPDLSGVWQSRSDASGQAGGIEGIVAPRYMIDLTIDMPDRDTLLRPAAAAIFKARGDNQYRDNPSILCLPLGVPRLDSYTHPFKIVQTPGLVVILYESQTLFRQIFTDGRPLPADPQPAWLGYSVGRWEGDTLVVRTAGFTDQTWLDGRGHPHSAAMKLTERFTRRNVGQMDIAITIDDPTMYTRPLTYTQTQQLLPEGELIEYVCNENHQANLPHVRPKPD